MKIILTLWTLEIASCLMEFLCIIWCVHIVGVHWIAVEWIYLLETKIILPQLSSLYSSTFLHHFYRALFTLNKGHLALRATMLSGCLSMDLHSVSSDLSFEPLCSHTPPSMWPSLSTSAPHNTTERALSFCEFWEASGMTQSLKIWVWKLGRILMGREAQQRMKPRTRWLYRVVCQTPRVEVFCGSQERREKSWSSIGALVLWTQVSLGNRAVPYWVNEGDQFISVCENFLSKHWKFHILKCSVLCKPECLVTQTHSDPILLSPHGS